MKLETENFRNVERETAEDLNRSCRTASDSAQLRSNDSIRFTIKSIAGGLSTTRIKADLHRRSLNDIT